MIGVVGSNGFIGSALCRYGRECLEEEVIGINRENYQRWASSKITWSLLIWAAGSARKDLDKDKLFDVNANAVSRAINDFKPEKFIYISSQAVYPEGTIGKEADAIPPDTISPYGYSKFCGELRAFAESNSYLCVRPNGFVGPNLKKNVIHSLMKSPPEAYYTDDSKFQIIHTDVFATICFMLASSYSNEIFNVTSREVITPVDVAHILGIDLKAVKMPSDRAVPHVQAILDTTKLQEALKTHNIVLPTTQEAISKWNQPFLPSFINASSVGGSGL